MEKGFTRKGLNALDKATQSVAVGVSRRKLLQKLPVVGAALGLSLATVKTASAANCYYEYETQTGSCGSCITFGCTGKKKQQRKRECCILDGGSVSCGSYGAWDYNCIRTGCTIC